MGSDVVKTMRQAVKGMGQDARFFRDSKRGEVSELRTELANSDVDIMKDAVKKVIAAITVGKDMNALFPDVINCMRTDNVEVKKLVYLYLINYAKSNPDLTIMAVNAFVKDSEHPSPLIRALAIRTMGCIRVDKITEYLVPPLKKALGDEDPYVRKTAALCVAKLYDISPSIVKQQGFIDHVRDLLSDANPTVVANAVAALNEIQDSSGKDVFEVTSAVLQKLLAALNECTEWGQVFILDSLAKYVPSDPREAENIIERVSPRLNHQNPAVVLSAVKIILMYMDPIANVETVNNICKKLAPPLISLAQAAQPEVQFVALRNINVIVQKRPHLLSHKIKVFFCKYNDPIYVKMEKLDILVKLTNDKNVDQVLLELKEYATEVDVEYVRRAVRTIGRCAIKLEVAAEKCIKVLLQLIQTKVNYVVQEAVVVIKDIFRRYPNRYESIIGVLCSSLESLDEPEAKASMIWIIGEYADRIDNAGELLQGFLDSFHDETTAVQLQLLTAAVKLFLKKPESSEELVQAVLSSATEKSDNPDLRDRGYIYWRLLSSDPDAAKAVVLAERPVIAEDTGSLDPILLEVLTRNLSTLSSVYHKPPESFVRRVRVTYEEEGVDDEDGDVYGDDEISGGVVDSDTPAVSSGGGRSHTQQQQQQSRNNDDDLLGLGAPSSSSSSRTSGNGLDLLGLGGGSGSSLVQQQQSSVPSLPEVGSKDGLIVHAAFSRRTRGVLALDLVLENASSNAPISSCALKFNNNPVGVSIASPAVNFSPITAGGKGFSSVPLLFSEALKGPAGDLVQIALKDNANGRVVFFNVPIAPSFKAFFSEDGALSVQEFGPQWKSLTGSECETTEVCRDLPTGDTSQLQDKLAKSGVCFFVVNKPSQDPSMVVSYYAIKAAGTQVFLELTFKQGFPGVKVTAKTSVGNVHIAKLTIAGLGQLLKA
jgi:AP-1 complex subunit beta-1